MRKHSVIFECNSHIGYKHILNEDAYRADAELGLWVIADGMGGHSNGRIASNIVVEQIFHQVKTDVSLTTAIQNSHKAILSAGKQDHKNKGMGSTVVALKLDGQHYEIASVGDSRAYLFSNTKLKQLTQDHTLVQELINQGTISPEQAKIHPCRHILKQALGSLTHDEVMIDVFTGKIGINDILLLCTDGLTSRIQHCKIESLFTESNSLQELMDKLIKTALTLGGHDNITVALIKCI